MLSRNCSILGLDVQSQPLLFPMPKLTNCSILGLDVQLQRNKNPPTALAGGAMFEKQCFIFASLLKTTSFWRML